MRLDLRDKLDNRRPCPNHGHALPREVVVVIPPCRVEQDTLEVLNAWDRRKRRFAERSVAEDEDISRNLTLRSGNVPALIVFVP